MRAAVLTIPLLLLAACKDEPRFEDRYAKATKEIEARAKAMDADIAESEAAAAAAAGSAAKPPAVEVVPGAKIPRMAPEPLPDTVKPSNPPASSGE